MNALIDNVLKTETPCGKAALWWLGQMGLIVKMGKTVLCIDCYANPSPARRVPPPVPAEEMAGIDAFVGTHDHSDHIDHASWQVWAKICPDARFVFPQKHKESVRRDGIAPERCVGLNDGNACTLGDIKISAVAAAHEFLNRDAETGLYPCLQYIVEGNGVRILHAGDTLRYEGMLSKLRAFGHFDAALLPVNGRDAKRYARGCIGNMTYQEAADLAGELDVSLVLPGHWDMFSDNAGDPEAFRDYLRVKYGECPRCMIPCIGQMILVSAGVQLSI